MAKVENTYNIPKLILEGRIQGWESVNTIFLSTFIREWYKEAYRSYTMRSELLDTPARDKDPPKYGQEDTDGKRWVQLKESTYRMKKSLKKRGKHTEYLSKVNTGAAKYVLENVIEKLDYKTDGINIRTGRLLTSYAPPPLVGNKLLAGPDQIIKVQPTSAEMDSKVPWARQIQFNRDRPLYDEGVEDEWTKRAIPKAMDAAKAEYDRLVQRNGGPPRIINHDNVSRSSNRRGRTRRNGRGTHRP